jgi:hypothetical protein
MYKRGRNKGDAPAYAGRRGMSHFRVVKGNDDTMRIRMWSTNIITAYPDGRVQIDTNGYHTHNTTIIRLNDALSMFFDGVRVKMYKQSVLSYSQPVLNVDGKRYSYYDGIRLSETGEVTTPLQAFEQKRVDRAETREFADDLQESGFKDAYALLYATTTPDALENNYHLFGVDISKVITNNDQADKWHMVIAKFKFERDYWSRSSGGSQWSEKADAKACWASLMQYCKKNMYVVSRSETFVL